MPRSGKQGSEKDEIADENEHGKEGDHKESVSAKETLGATLLCDAPEDELLYSGQSEGIKDCEDKCTLASACIFYSISQKNKCVLTSTCRKTKSDPKGVTYCIFTQNIPEGSNMVLWVFFVVLFVLCIIAFLFLLFRGQRSGYKPVNHADITKQIEEEMGGRPVAFKDHDYHLKQEGQLVVEKLARVLQRHPTSEVCVKILGYTGKPAGKWNTNELCKKLGYKRALRITEALERQGCKHKIVPIGCGNVVGKGATCEIHACTEAEAARVQREAENRGQDPDMTIP